MPSSERARWALAVLGGTLLIVVVQVLWLAANRRGYPLDVDESGYMTIALIDHARLAGGGLDDYWQAIQEQVPNAPLVPALTALVYSVHTGILASFTVLLGFLVLLVMAVYGLAERLAGPRIGALAALVIATSPGALAFSRHYVFALPAAALLACAVYALVRSDGMRSTRWAAGVGVALGLMVLARTLTVAFLPGVALAAVVLVVARGVDRRRLLNMALAACASVAVAALWYARNFDSVRDYLTSFGYGSKSAEYGSDSSLLSVRRWFLTLQKAGFESLHLILLLMLVGAVIAIAVVAVRRVLADPDRRAAVRRLAGSDAFAVAVVLIVGYVALTSSRNRGLGFSLPLVPLLVVLGVAAIRYLPRARTPLVAGLIAVAVVNFVSESGVVDAFGKRRDVTLPALGTVPVIDAQPSPVGAMREQVPGPKLHFAGHDKQWLDVDHELAGFVLGFAEREGVERGPVVAFATRHRVMNTNSVALASVLWFRREVPMAQLTPDGGDTAAAYAAFLSDPAHGLPNFVFTASTNAGDFSPAVTQSEVERAARSLGFRVVRTARLPDGRVLRMWWLPR